MYGSITFSRHTPWQLETAVVVVPYIRRRSVLWGIWISRFCRGMNHTCCSSSAGFLQVSSRWSVLTASNAARRQGKVSNTAQVPDAMHVCVGLQCAQARRASVCTHSVQLRAISCRRLDVPYLQSRHHTSIPQVRRVLRQTAFSALPQMQAAAAGLSQARSHPEQNVI